MTTGPTAGKVTTPAGGPDGMPLALRLNEGLGIASSGAPRVEACIHAVMQRYPKLCGRTDSRYYEAVHQELAPLARELEREVSELRSQLLKLEVDHVHPA